MHKHCLGSATGFDARYASVAKKLQSWCCMGCLRSCFPPLPTTTDKSLQLTSSFQGLLCLLLLVWYMLYVLHSTYCDSSTALYSKVFKREMETLLLQLNCRDILVSRTQAAIWVGCKKTSQSEIRSVTTTSGLGRGYISH